MFQAVKPHLHDEKYAFVALPFTFPPFLAPLLPHMETFYHKKKNEILFEGWISFILSDVSTVLPENLCKIKE